MLLPKRVKYRRVQRGRMKGKATRGNKVTYGEYGLMATEPSWITSNQIEAARVAMTRYTDVYKRQDALSLSAGADLHKRRSCCFGERKYFSSALFIKISDKVHPLAGLRDAEIFAVQHLPFHTIPQSIQRMEDGRKRPASVMVKQAGYVFKQQIRCV